MKYTSSEVYKKISQETKDPIVERRTCAISQTSFPLFQSEKNLLEKLSYRIANQNIQLPLPTLCPEIRLLQKLLFINQTKFYNNACALSGQKTISRLSPQSGYAIYTNKNRSSDERESSDYGMDIDEHKSVMDHICHLTQATPYQDLIGSLSNTETNAVYTNYTSDIADSYMVWDANNVEKSCYSMLILNATYAIDCLSCSYVENCYQCVDSDHIFACFYCTKVVWTKYSRYMTDCQNCDYCIGCVWLNGKKYYILNQASDEQTYHKTLEKLQDKEYREQFVHQWMDISNNRPRPAVTIVGSEDVSGSDILESNRVHWSFTIRDSQDICYSYNLQSSQDCLDVFSYGHESYCMYNSVQAWRYSHHIYRSSTIGKWENLFYCIEVKKSKNCFGCVNMRDKEYCIFNKQYTKEQYESIVPKLLERIQSEWSGYDFLWSQCSPFPYNDTFAMMYFPIRTIHYPSTSQVLDQNGQLDVYVDDTESFISKAWLQVSNGVRRPIWWRNKQWEINIPDNIELLYKEDVANIQDYDSTILHKAIVCEVSGRPFRIVAIELEFYKKYRLDLPTIHPDIRHEKRFLSRANRTLHIRSCSQTGEEILSIYPQNVPFPVYSQKAYSDHMYK